MRPPAFCFALLAAAPAPCFAATPGDALLAEYFARQTEAIAGSCLAEIGSAADWEARRSSLRAELAAMLGLDPMPGRTPLQATVTGTDVSDGIKVERLHFQSRPGLYVTANFFLPDPLPEEPLPAVLYVCGHGPNKEGDISFGNKVTYHRHGAWFARNGYACLVLDTVQLGELEGLHHGTYREGMWWWNANGYTPAGTEAWNSIRALDYLETRPEVDASRFGVTGRSGGGAYSWWLSALDDRVKVSVPVAGITSLENHVVDGCIEGHCDCMYFINTRRWDFAAVSALVAPRPLLLTNTDRDTIFPLDGVMDVYWKTKRIYDLLGAGEKLGLQISEGPHKDTQQLRVAAFHWFNKFLKGDDSNTPIDDPATDVFSRDQLKVFGAPPADELTTTIHESFAPLAEPPAAPGTLTEFQNLADGWMDALRTEVFAGWPAAGESGPLAVEDAGETGGHRHFTFLSQHPFRLPLLVRRAGDGPVGRATVRLVLDDGAWEKAAGDGSPALADGAAEVLVFPRGVGPTAWSADERARTHIRRRFVLLGQTLDGMRTYDLVRAVEAVGELPGFAGAELTLEGEGAGAVVALYASLFSPEVDGVVLQSPPATHRDGPIFPFVRRVLEPPQAAAMAAVRFPVVIHTGEPDAWAFTRDVAGLVDGEGRVTISEEGAGR